MHIPKEELPVKFAVPGAVARQVTDFGDATPYGRIAGEYFSLAAGTDISPLLRGLDNDSCHSPHWGYVMEGQLVVSYDQQPEEACVRGDIFYWPPGHSVRVTDDAEVILFSPQDEHVAVLDHMLNVMTASGD
jgi:hypothetical protein